MKSFNFVSQKSTIVKHALQKDTTSSSQDMPFFHILESMVAYTPIPLFAESLRVQQALVSTILTRCSTSPCLTGCIKDFQRLWNIDDIELLGQFEDSPTASTVSIRHGSVFQLANKAILDACQITGKRSSRAVHNLKAFRETTVNISFITSDTSDFTVKHQRWRAWMASLVVLFEVAVTIGISIVLAHHDQLVGSGLLACIATITIILFIIRQRMSPIFAKANDLHTDRYLTARGGAALDVHIIAENWNSLRFDVVCGYSSQLHALTNIPVRVNKPLFLKWSCRLLAILLVIQAAALASTTNAKGIERWSGMVWLSIYLLFLLMKRALHFLQGPEQLLESQPASIQLVESLRFSGRRAALVFIATLPVSHKVDRWAWWDTFMPDNERRREFQAELETSELFAGQTALITEERESSGLNKRSPITKMILEEVAAALKIPSFELCLKSYQEVVFPAISARTSNREV